MKFIILLTLLLIPFLFFYFCKNTCTQSKYTSKKFIESFNSTSSSKNVAIINPFDFHYETLESLFTIFLEKIYNNQYTFQIYMYIYPNKEYEKYILSKYQNVKFISNYPLKNLEIDIEIYATTYPNEINKIKYLNSTSGNKNRYYISHRVDAELLKITNVYYLTPLCGNNNYIIPYVLPKIQKKKGTIPVFCVQGNIDEKRRNFRSLIPLFENFKNKDFIVKIIGKGQLPYYLEKYKDKIRIESNLNFIDYHKAFEDVYVILALIDDTFEHNYFTTQLTSSISYSIGYDIPILYFIKLNDIYKLKNSIVYNSQGEMVEKFGSLIETY